MTPDDRLDRSLRASIDPLDWCVLADRLEERAGVLASGSEVQRGEADFLDIDAAILRRAAEIKLSPRPWDAMKRATDEVYSTWGKAAPGTDAGAAG